MLETWFGTPVSGAALVAALAGALVAALVDHHLEQVRHVGHVGQARGVREGIADVAQQVDDLGKGAGRCSHVVNAVARFLLPLLQEIFQLLEAFAIVAAFETIRTHGIPRWGMNRLVE